MKKQIAVLAALSVFTGMHTALPAPAASAAESAALPANPVISRNVPAYSETAANPNEGNDDHYYTSWRCTAPDYLAYDLSGVPAEQRKQVVAVWYNTSTYDNIGSYVSRNNEPVDYVIELNDAAGGEYPADGWKTVKTVTDNALSSRQCLINMGGSNWIRLRVTKTLGDNAVLNFDIHDASQGVYDSWLFLGDSITAGGMVNAWGTSFSAQINAIDGSYYPVQENGGIGGTSSYHGKDAIEKWLADSSARFVSIAYGTNDAWGNQTGADRYYDCEKSMIDAVLAAGKIPVLPTIPFSTNKDVASNLESYNAKINRLYTEYGSKIVHGPDLYGIIKEHPEYLSSDGVHPSSEGYEEIRRIWAETMYETVYKNGVQMSENARYGDINGDGSYDLADAVTLQLFLLARITAVPDWEAGDLDGNDVLNAADLTNMLRDLFCGYNGPYSVVYEAENGTLAGAIQVIDDGDASGTQAVQNFGSDADTLTFSIEIPADGSYQLIFRSKGIGGDKENNVLVDGVNAGSIHSTADSFSDAVLRRVIMTKGRHSVTVTKSWGWIVLDNLTVKDDEAISNDVYDVSNKLSDKKATSPTRKLYQYLCDNYGKVTLAGQVCDDGLEGKECKEIFEITGKYPAVLGLDMMDYTPSRTALGAKSHAVDTAIEFRKAGGIVTFCWHWNAPTKYLKSGNDANGNPRWWGGFSTANTNFDIAAVMNGRDEEGKALLDADIKEIATQLKKLQDANVPVLWRPLHEASGGWFWWGAKGADAYKSLYKYLYKELTDTYGCHNLIWVWNGQDADWYPGDEYVDIIGEDIYAGEHAYGAQNAKFSDLLEYSSTNKIIALSENGTVFDIDNVIAANSRWMWFGTWCGEFVLENGKYTERYTEKEILKKTYQSEYVITLDELPNL